MLKKITLLALIVLNFTAQPVCGGNTFIPLCESEAKKRETAQRAAMASAVSARLATGERIETIETWVHIEAIDYIIRHTVYLEKRDSFDWRTKQAIEAFSRNLQRTPIAATQSKQ